MTAIGVAFPDFFKLITATQITLDLSGTKLTRIEADTFGEWKKSKEVKLPDCLAEVGNAFQGSGLVTIDLSGTKVAKLDEFAFDGCMELKEVKLPDCLAKIRASAFRDCPNLTSMNFPPSLKPKNVDSAAFNNSPIKKQWRLAKKGR